MHLFLRLFKKEFCLTNDLFRFLQCLFDLICLLKDAHIVSTLKFILFLLEKLSANFRFLIKFFSLELDVDEICIFEKAGEFVKFLLLKDFKLFVKRVKEIDDRLSELIFQIEFTALYN